MPSPSDRGGPAPTVVTPLDVWSSDERVALRAAREFADAPAITGAELTQSSSLTPRTIHLAAPILLPGHELLAAACLGWTEAQVRDVVDGAAVVGSPDDGPSGTSALRPLLLASTTEAAAKLRAEGLSPEQLLVDRVPVPILTMDDAGGMGVLSPLARAFHQLWLVDKCARRLLELDAPPVLVQDGFRSRARAAEALASAVHGRDRVWSADENASEGSGKLHVPHPGDVGPRQPTSPIAICFVDGGVLVAYPYALVHFDSEEGRILAVVPSDELRFNAVSEDGRFVQCLPRGLASGSFWPQVAVYDVAARAFRSTLPESPLPTQIVSALSEMKVLQVFDLEGLRSASLSVERLGETASHMVTTPDGRVAWRRIDAGGDTRGLFDIATDRTVWMPKPLDDAAPSYDDDDFSVRAAVVLADGRVRLFRGDRLFEGHAETFRASAGTAAAFDRAGKRFALAGRDAIRLFSLGEDGKPTRALRFDALPLRGVLTLDAFYGKHRWDVLEDDVLRTFGTPRALAKVESAEALATTVSESTWKTIDVDAVRGLFEASRSLHAGDARALTLPRLDVAPSEHGPEAALLQEDALVRPLARWVSEKGATLRGLAFGVAASGARVKDRYVTESDDGRADSGHEGLHEWIFVGEHGLLHLFEIPCANVVFAASRDPRALAVLGPQPSLGADPLRQALLAPMKALNEPLAGPWSGGSQANAWAVGIAGTEHACAQFIEAAMENDDPESATIVENLVRRRKLHAIE